MVLLVLMAATAGDPGCHAMLADRLGLDWPDLTGLRWWRVPLSPLLQEDVGIRWSIIALFPALFLAESRLGSRLMLLAFFACDALSSVPTLAALEGLGNVGFTEARELAGEPNLGSSSGLIGLLAVWVGSLPATNRRAWAVAALAVFVAANLAVERDLASIQHGVAMMVGMGLAVVVRHTSSARGDAISPAVPQRW